MAISRQKKSELLEMLSDGLSKAKSAVFVNFHGLSVGEANDLRKKLRAEGVFYKVGKKTIVGKALDKVTLKGERPQLDGEVAVAWGADLIAPAKGIHNFAKEHEGKISILGGLFDGDYKNKTEMMAIATIPSMDTLRAQFVMLINSPIQGFVMALSEIAKKK